MTDNKAFYSTQWLEGVNDKHAENNFSAVKSEIRSRRAKKVLVKRNFPFFALVIKVEKIKKRIAIMPFALALFYTRLMQFFDIIVHALITNCQCF